MTTWQVKTPVVLLIFNRPESVAQVLEAVRQARPTKLLVVADGPRRDRPDDFQQCAAARAVLDQIDWQCDVLTNFSDTNLGCKQRVSSGLTWVFNLVDEAIILEDDCIPHPTFFRFCDDLLERYRDDKRVMVIAGSNFQFGRRRTNYSYYFSRYNHCWGWATWKRAWSYYDSEMKLWSLIRDGNWLQDILQDRRAADTWKHFFQSVYDHSVDSWAFRWTFACWLQNGLSILPNVNLVSNIGFYPEATHTKDRRSKFANMPVEAMTFPLQHPAYLIPDRVADTVTQKTLYQIPLRRRLKHFLKRLLQGGLTKM